MKYRIDFENMKGFFYIERPTPNECNFYDENKHLLIHHTYKCADSVDNDIETLSKYNYLDDFLCCLCDSYDFGETPQDVLKEYMYDIVECCDYDYVTSQNDLCEEVKEILFDCEFMTDLELCEKWDICKFGDTYIRVRD